MNEGKDKVTVVVTKGRESSDVLGDLKHQYALAFPHSIPKNLFVESVADFEATTLKDLFNDYSNRIADGKLQTA